MIGTWASVRRWRSLGGVLLVLALLLVPLALAKAQPRDYAPPPGNAGGYQIYPLKHTSAPALREQLNTLLSSLPGQFDVVVDERNNRLLVSGPAHAHDVVRQLIQAQDRPAANPSGPPVVKLFPLPPEQLNATAARLSSQFPPETGVRIAPDARGSQLVVLAPPETLPEIEAVIHGGHWRAPQPLPATAQDDSAVTPALGMMTLRQGSKLQIALRTPWEKILPRLQQLWGASLEASPVAAGDAQALSVYTARLKDNLQVRLQVDVQDNTVAVLGPEPLASKCAELLGVLDRSLRDARVKTQVAPIGNAEKAKILKAVSAVQNGRFANGDTQGRQGDFVAMLFQQRPPVVEAQPPASQNQPPVVNQNQPLAPADPRLGAEGEAVIGGMVGKVRVEVIEGVGIVISGPEADVQRVRALIQQIVEISQESAPEIRILQLRHVNSLSLAGIVREVYDSVYIGRQGQISITPLARPNALLLIGQESAVATAVGLAQRLDTQASPGAQFEFFQLQHASAIAAQQTLQLLYPEEQEQDQQAALEPRLRVIADVRSNSLVVRGSPRDLAEVSVLLKKLDTDSTPSELVLKVFKLENALAEDLAFVLLGAIGGTAGAAAQQSGPLGQPGQPGGLQGLGQAGQQQNQQQAQQRSAILKFFTLDARGRRFLKSGILTNVTVTADVRANALLVTAPAESMELLGALIQELDQIPAAESQIKVFTIINGDAESLTDMLETLFGQQQAQFGGPVAAASIQGESTLIPLRFAIDTRTNSIIATGSATDLTIVEAILLRLDESDVRDRLTRVYRLNNAPAQSVSDAINAFLQRERDVQELGVRSTFEQIQEEVVVVPEIVTNSLIISATPRFIEEIEDIVDELDKRRPMVIVQVLLAEVTLNNTDEFGVELGLQDSVLFDRSLLGDLVTTTNSTQVNNAGAVQTVTNEIIQGATLTPGFLFNNQPLGNSGSDLSRASASDAAGQALTNFAVGRINGELGYGGLVLSAASESVNILIRALQECRRLDILSRPQIMTLENQPAFIQVGERVQLIAASSTDQVTGVTTNTLGTPQNVGLILGVTPRVTPDGMVVMEIDVERSRVGPEAEGVPIAIGTTGDVIRSPNIETQLAQTTVMAMNGQTIVLGGLINKTKSTVHRRVPLLASVPILGHLFRYDNETNERRELIMIMTPRVVESEADAEFIKQVEASRMSWVLSDVRKMHGDANLRSRWDKWDHAEVPTIFPDLNPHGRTTSGPGGVQMEIIDDRPALPPEGLRLEPTPLNPIPQDVESLPQAMDPSQPRFTPGPQLGKSPSDVRGPAAPIQQQSGLQFRQPPASGSSQPMPLRPVLQEPRLIPPGTPVGPGAVQPLNYRFPQPQGQPRQLDPRMMPMPRQPWPGKVPPTRQTPPAQMPAAQRPAQPMLRTNPTYSQAPYPPSVRTPMPAGVPRQFVPQSVSPVKGAAYRTDGGAPYFDGPIQPPYQQTYLR